MGKIKWVNGNRTALDVRIANGVKRIQLEADVTILKRSV